MQTVTNEDGSTSEVEVNVPDVIEFASEGADLSFPSETTALYANIVTNEEGEIIEPISFDDENTIDRVTGVKVMYDSGVECDLEGEVDGKLPNYIFELSIFCNSSIKETETGGIKAAQPLPEIAGI
jgi:hypothetical protein